MLIKVRRCFLNISVNIIQEYHDSGNPMGLQVVYLRMKTGERNVSSFPKTLDCQLFILIATLKLSEIFILAFPCECQAVHHDVSKFLVKRIALWGRFPH